MQIKLGTGNRITLPKDICNQLNLEIGQQLELEIVDDQIIISSNKIEKPVNKEIVKPKIEKHIEQKDNKVDSKIIIKSNLEDAIKYVDPKFSECGLVVRSKRRYLRDFCNVCKGQLTHKNCIYFKEEENNNIINVKTVKNEIFENIAKLQKQLDKKQSNLKSNRSSTTTLRPIQYDKAKKCENCDTKVTKGFLIDDDFMCTSCACEDFKKYLIKYKGE